MKIPIVDCQNNIDGHSGQIFAALKDAAFVYLTNFGIAPPEVDALMKTARDFFALPPDTKERFAKPSLASAESGYVAAGKESLTYDGSTELHESFNFTPPKPGAVPTDSDVPGFHSSMDSFFARCMDVSFEILSAIAKELDVPPKQLLDAHSFAHQKGNLTTLRVLSCPPVSAEEEAAGAIRLGAHSDWGTLTLLFQDSVGGLQVLGREGEWVDAVPVAGSVLINTADMLQRWSSDVLVSTKHRVVVRGSSATSRRHSAAFFLTPDDGAPVESLKDRRYGPTTADQHIRTMLQRAFQGHEG